MTFLHTFSIVAMVIPGGLEYFPFSYFGVIVQDERNILLDSCSIFLNLFIRPVCYFKVIPIALKILIFSRENHVSYKRDI